MYYLSFPPLLALVAAPDFLAAAAATLIIVRAMEGSIFLLPEIRQSVRHRGSLEREFFSRLEALTLFAAAATD